MNSKLKNALCGGLLGVVAGIILFWIISSFFGKTWSIEEGVPIIVFLSPLVVPIITGAIVGIKGNFVKSLLASFVSGIAYLIVGVLILVIGGMFLSGWSGILGVLLLVGLFGSEGTVLIIFLKD